MFTRKVHEGLEKVVNDRGEVAIIVHVGFGGGWYSWYNNIQCLFHPEIALWILKGKDPETAKFDLKHILNNEYIEKDLAFLSELEVVWVKEGDEFRITEYDGSEGVQLKSQVKWIIA